MQKQEWDKISELVLEVIGLPKNERESRLRQLCTDDAGRFDDELFLAAFSLVQASDDADTNDALASPFEGVATVAADELEISAPDDLERTIGPWTIKEQIGAGGMGVVYRARRTDKSFDQKAALKLVRPGFGEDFRHRFIKERALLAQLNHPGIARLLDGGIYKDETPYLAVELVEGNPITKYCDENGLSLEARLRLFTQACDAISFAHRNLVVHRDLKPGHIMIEDSTGKPRAKLLDFGIARILEGENPEDDTRSGFGPLTPAYAAPEQIKGESITTATDIYSLGVILYELLSGERPYVLQDKTPSQIETIVCDTLPSKPSNLKPASRFSSDLKGDLDHIVLKALSKEPERRYRSAEAFSDDIDRYLDGLPIEAQSGQLFYRTKKFLGRNMAAVVASALVALTISSLLFVFTQRLSDERNKAQEAAAEAIDEAKRKDAVASFLGGILRAPNSRWYVDRKKKGVDVTILEVMEETADMIDSVFVDSPDIAADLHHIMGDTFGSIGNVEKSIYHHTRTYDLRLAYYEAPHPKIVEALYYMSVVRIAEGDFAGRALMQHAAIQMYQQRPGGNNYPFMLQEIGGMAFLAGNIAMHDSLLLERASYVKKTFVPGHDGFKYRESLLSQLVFESVLSSLANKDIQKTRANIARAYEEIDKQSLSMRADRWRLLQCHEAELVKLEGRKVPYSLLNNCIEFDKNRSTLNPYPRDLTDFKVQRSDKIIRRRHAELFLSFLEGKELTEELIELKNEVLTLAEEKQKMASGYKASGLFD